MMHDYVLLTGATGLLGQYLLRDLLRRGLRIAVIIRSRGSQSAQDRLARILAHWESELDPDLPRPVCLEGDITAANLGLNAEDRLWVADRCRSVLHNAASLTFFGKDRSQDPWLSNLTGTANVLEFCRQTKLRELHYISTAYVCGRTSGTIWEVDLDRGQEFRNDYEHCKCEAEKLVRAASFLDRPTIYRPAVIVGDSRTGYTATYHALYTYLHFAWTLCQHARRDEAGRCALPLRLNLTGEEGRNLVSVDWVSAVTTHIVVDSKYHGRTYHLTPSRPVTVRQIDDAMSAYFKYYGPTFAGPDGLTNQELNEVEKTFYSYVERYQPYWNGEPTFDCTNTCTFAAHLPCPRIDTRLLHRLIDYALHDRWGKRRRERDLGCATHSVGVVSAGP
jgi:nucleoside-diphosphate-sugar epimerase